jgi:cytochrome c5
MSVISKPLSLLLALAIAGCASAGSAADPAAGATPAAPEAAAPTQPEAPAPTADASGVGHFSEAQAGNGRDTFRALCTECHYSGEFSDAQFKFKWSRRSADSLYDMIFTQMPESAPGSLSPEEAVSLVAYILRMNGFEAGANELAPDAEVLSQISLRPIRN